MSDGILFQLSMVVIFIASIFCFLVATEAGFRVGGRAQARVNDASRSEISTIQGAMLGLLALMLGFTFSMAMSRFEVRKQLVLEEANAIGTTFLRAQLLPEPSRKEVSHLLLQYVEVRLDFYKAGIDPKKLQDARDRTEQLQQQLWSEAITLGGKEPRAIPIGLFIQSLNEVIDLHTKRINALENHVPEIILVLLYFVAIIVTGLIGYGCGLGGKRNFFVTLTASVLIAAVILVIIDLDRPRRGLIKVSQQRLIELRDSLAKN